MAKWDHDDLRNHANDVVAEWRQALDALRVAAESSSLQKMQTSSRQRVIDGDSAMRKTFPMATGLLDYFPDACAEVARISYLGNEKHNPGEPMHHARGKSADHPDCIMRHLTERGGFDVIVIEGVSHKVRHSAALAWRAMALLQEELERDLGLPLPRGARAA